jgi:predicted CXXCH cytochrome family protein
MKRSILWVGLISLAVVFCEGHLSDRGHGEEAKDEKWPRIDQSQYAGSEKCAECHQSYYDGWKDSAHNKMIRPPKSEGPDRTVLADFSKASPERTFELKEVKWVIGHRWKQRFIGEVDGQEVVFPAQWSIKEKKWQPYEGRSDWWYPTHKDWKKRSNFKLCAGCHSTGPDHYTQKWVELNIACESCHGPGKAHVEKPRLDNIVNPARLTVARSMDVCLSCHQAGKPPGDEYAWPVGYQPGMELSKFWKGFKPEEGKQTAEFWHNGTAHKNRVQGNTFLQSVMSHEGLQCTNCHESHGSRHRSLNVKSAETNALCLTCHGPEKSPGPRYKVLSDHTHHEPLSAGSRCIECHMPKTGENSVTAEARNHTFNFISPADTVKNGDPNSCNSCHTDKTPQWALTEVKKWYPKLK